MEALTGVSIADLSAPGLLLVVALMVYLGLLVPRPFHKQALADRDARLAEKDVRLEEQSAMIDKQAKQIDLLLDATQTTRHLLESLPLDEARRGDALATEED